VLRSSLTRALPACLAVAALAACADAPTSPTARAPEGAPRAAFVGVPELPGIVEVRDASGTLVGGQTVAFWRELKDSVHVLDNSALDLDKAAGRFRVLMPTGTMFRAYLRATTPEYASTMPGGSNMQPVNGEVQFGTLTVAVRPIVRVSMYDRRKRLAPGATVSVTGSWKYTATDGTSSDLAIGGATGAYDGIITLRAPYEGTHTLCEVTPPSGFLLATPNCVTFTAKFGMVHLFTFKHETGIIAPPPPAES
jgi:hypothetical protein